VFTEKQQFRQGWLWALLIIVFIAVALGLIGVIDAYLKDDVEAWVLVVFGLGALLTAALFGFFMFGAMITEVREDGLAVRFQPVWGKVISYDEIESAVAREYSPLREYGGWGYRIGPNGRAYTVSGRHGVQLTLKNDRPLLIGSQEPETLAAAIFQHLG
jgi:hypothetical protein